MIPPPLSLLLLPQPQPLLLLLLLLLRLPLPSPHHYPNPKRHFDRLAPLGARWLDCIIWHCMPRPLPHHTLRNARLPLTNAHARFQLCPSGFCQR